MAMTTTHDRRITGRKEASMAYITVNIADTVGQESAIAANGGPVFTVRVTHPATDEAPGFGRVVGLGPVAGYEILYKTTSVVEEETVLMHPDGLVALG